MNLLHREAASLRRRYYRLVLLGDYFGLSLDELVRESRELNPSGEYEKPKCGN